MTTGPDDAGSPVAPTPATVPRQMLDTYSAELETWKAVSIGADYDSVSQ